MGSVYYGNIFEANLYKLASFKDPQTAAALGRIEYPFMVHGPISPLSISGKPIFFTALDYFTEFQESNSF